MKRSWNETEDTTELQINMPSPEEVLVPQISVWLKKFVKNIKLIRPLYGLI